MVLLHLLRWLRTSSDIEAALLLGGSGPMHDAFSAVAPTLALDRIPGPPWPRLLRRASRGAFDRIAHDLRWAEVRRWVWRNGPPRLIYGNTITNGGILAHLPDLGCEACPVITHVHELAARIRAVVTAADLATTKRVTTHYVAVSGAVRRNLIDSVGIEPERISVIHEFIPSEVEVAPGARENIRRELGWPSDAFVVGGSGSPGWGKGVDLFVQLALQMIRRRQDAPLRFLWVGGDWNRPGTFEDMMQRDVSHARLQDRVRFIGTCSNPADYYGVRRLRAHVAGGFVSAGRARGCAVGEPDRVLSRGRWRGGVRRGRLRLLRALPGRIGHGRSGAGPLRFARPEANHGQAGGRQVQRSAPGRCRWAARGRLGSPGRVGPERPMKARRSRGYSVFKYSSSAARSPAPGSSPDVWPPLPYPGSVLS
jgi:glycosyltransferase involved in cell wall biosynthesis